MVKKNISDKELEEIGKCLSAALKLQVKLWEQCMKGFLINSSEYKTICRAGKTVQESYFTMRAYAEQRWSYEQVRSVFTENSFTYFS